MSGHQERRRKARPRNIPKGDRKAYIRASFSSQPIPWTFLSESLSLLNWSLDCSSWRKILAYPSVSSRCLIGTRDFWIGPWTKSPHFFCSSHSPCSLQGEILSCPHRLVPSVGKRLFINIGSAMPRWWINSTISRKLSGLEFRVVSCRFQVSFTGCVCPWRTWVQSRWCFFWAGVLPGFPSRTLAKPSSLRIIGFRTSNSSLINWSFQLSGSHF